MRPARRIFTLPPNSGDLPARLHLTPIDILVCGFMVFSNTVFLDYFGDWKVPKTRRQECLRYADRD